MTFRALSTRTSTDKDKVKFSLANSAMGIEKEEQELKHEPKSQRPYVEQTGIRLDIAEPKRDRVQSRKVVRLLMLNIGSANDNRPGLSR